jgi:hypothetical protein
MLGEEVSVSIRRRRVSLKELDIYAVPTNEKAAPDISDAADNFTTFVLRAALGRDSRLQSGSLFGLLARRGSLFDFLQLCSFRSKSSAT